MNYTFNAKVIILIHITLIIAGIALIVIAAYQKDGGFSQSLLLNIGSNLIVVTFIFALMFIFRENSAEILPNTNSENTESASNKFITDGEHEVVKDEFPVNLEGALRNRSGRPVTGSHDRDY